jgi:predicted RNA-binding Zn ribbon-like protein
VQESLTVGGIPGPGEGNSSASLALVADFVNTLDIEDGTEQLDSVESLGRWMAERGLLGPHEVLSEADLLRAMEVREVLRSLLLANNHAIRDVPSPDMEVLNRAATRARFLIRFDQSSVRLVPEALGMDGALGRILVNVYSAMADESWSRLKACRSETCHWAFVDQSKNSSGTWCSMGICGNRAKARGYRERRKAKLS